MTGEERTEVHESHTLHPTIQAQEKYMATSKLLKQTIPQKL